ncbi:TPA: hypothetical protein WH350_001445 [Neisseria meningitidis]
MSIYAVAHIVHLYCAIAFVGGVFFEVLVLSVLHTGLVSCEARREVENAMSYRAVRVMPFVVGLLFAIAVVKMARSTLTVGWSKYIHTVVFTHMLLIVFLAKAMFYISW